MKTVIVIGDGVADRPQAELGGATPLEHAFIPNLTFLAQRGRTGLADCVFDDLPVGSIVAALGILGYNPYEYFPNGRASFEALAGGIRVERGDLAFRCNLISLENDRIKDFTAGLIDDDTARNLVVHVKTGHPKIELFPGQSYRNILVYRDAGVSASDFVCAPPHENRMRPIDELWVRGRTPKAQSIADELNQFLRQSREQLRELRREYPSQADILWLWSPSDTPALPPFRARFGSTGAIVGGLKFIAGIGIAAQMYAAHVPGATGYIDSNLPGKAQAAIDLLEKHDFVLVHVNAADEEGHQRNLAGKIRAIELIDEQIVGPIVRHLRRRFPDGHRFAFLPDHYTCVDDGQHIVHPVPYLVSGTGIVRDETQAYSEPAAAARGAQPIKAWDLLPYLLNPRST